MDKLAKYFRKIKDGLDEKFHQASGTDLWQLLDIYESMLSAGATCDQLAGMIFEFSEMLHITCYLSELDRLYGDLMAASETYYEHCAGEGYQLTGHVLPEEAAGNLTLTAYEFEGESGLPGFLAWIVAGIGTAVFIEEGSSVATLTMTQKLSAPYKEYYNPLFPGGVLKLPVKGPRITAELVARLNGLAAAGLQLAVVGYTIGGIELIKAIADLISDLPPFHIPQTGDEGRVYPGGTIFSWTAHPTEGWFFDSLTTVDGGAVIEEGAHGTGILTLFSDTILELKFTREPFTLTTIPDPLEGGTIAPAGTTKHEADEEVDVYANPKAQYQFLRWSGDATGREPAIKVIMDRDKTVIGQFIHEWILTTESDPPEGGSTFPEEVEGLDKDLIVITATPNEQYVFSQWTGDFESVDNPATVELNDDKLITAVFEKKLKLTVSSSPPEGGTTVPAGEFFLPALTEVTILAQPNEGYEFVNWTGDKAGSETVLIFTIREDTSIVANFRAVYKLTTSASPEYAGTVSPEGTTEYDANEEVTVTATEIGQHSFSNWGGDISGTANPTIVKMDSSKNVIANFNEPVTLTVSVDPPEGGTTNQTGVTEHKLGDSVDVVASPTDNTWTFLGWEGDVVSTVNPLTVVMDGNKVITARFARKKRLTISVNPPEAGSYSPSGDQLYLPNEEVVILAIPDEEHLFDNWSGDIESTNNPETVSMTDDITVIGNLVLKRTLIVSATEGGRVDPEGIIELKDGEEITLTAYLDTGQEFAGWDGDAVGLTNPLTITMDRDKSIIATFSRRYRLTTYADATRGTIAPAGTTWYNPGEEVTVAAAPLHEGFLFLGFEGDLRGAESPQVIIMNEDKDVWAKFSESCRLTTSVDGEGTISSPPESFIAKGTEVVISATADEGWAFHAWGGDIFLSGNPLKFIIEEDTEVVAIFKEVFSLTTEVSPEGNPGTVDPSGTSYYKDGTEVVITANPHKNFIFSYWSGMEEGIWDNPTTIIMDEDKTITAHFLKATSLTITVNPPTRGYTIPPGLLPEPELRFVLNEEVTIMAYSASEGWMFDHWSGDYSSPENPNNSRDNPITLGMSKDKAVTAHFVETSPEPIKNPVTITIDAVSDGTEEGKDGGRAEPQTITVEADSDIVLQATPDEDYDFDTWEDDGDWGDDEEGIDDKSNPNAKVKPKKDHRLRGRFVYNWEKLERRVLEIERDIQASPTDCEVLMSSYEAMQEIFEKELNAIPFRIQDEITRVMWQLEEFYSTSCQPLLHFALLGTEPPEAGRLTREITYAPDPGSFKYPVLFPPTGGIGEASDIWYKNSQFFIYAHPEVAFEFEAWFFQGGSFNNSTVHDHPAWWTLTEKSSIGALLRQKD